MLQRRGTCIPGVTRWTSCAPIRSLTLGLFLGLLGLLWLVVKLKAPGISRFASGGRLRVAEAAALGPQERAAIPRRGRA